MKKGFSKYIILIISIVIIFGFNSKIKAAENTALEWNLTSVSLEHTTVSFSLSGVNSAQSAIAVVEDIDDGSKIETPFTIKTSSANYQLKFPDGKYIKAKGETWKVAYRVYIKDSSGNSTNLKGTYLYECSMPLYSLNAYPKRVEIANSTYSKTVKYTVSVGFSTYSQMVSDGNYTCIDYSEQSVGTRVAVKAECAYGCTKEEEVVVRENIVSKPELFGYNECVLRDKVITYHKSNDIRMCARINGKTYYGEYGGIDNKGSIIAVKYPVVKAGTVITLWYESARGGVSEETKYVAKSCDISAWDFDDEDVFNYITHTQASGTILYYTYDQRPTKVSIAIANKTYSAKVQSDGSFIIKYPYQSKNTALNMVISDEHGCSKTVRLWVESRVYSIDLLSVRFDSIWGELEDFGNDEGTIQEVYAMIGGKKYNGKFFGNYGSYEFSINYPKQKVGSKIKIYLKDSTGYYYTKETTIKNKPPKIKIDNITSNSKEITGKTVADATVKIKIGKKTYTKKANKKGKFSLKIKGFKVGTKINISVETKEGYTNNKSKKVKLAYGNIEHYYIYPNSTTMRCIVKRAKKGDIILVKVGEDVYKKKIKKDIKNNVVKVKISKHSVGQKVQVILRDPFGKKKDTSSSMVFIGEKIYVGMSAQNALLTTWGKPVRRNNYGGMQQWVFEWGSTTLYVYIRGGKVTNIQQLNY